jgi:aspartyl-tRNA(Asn)/glutamyl-tRNA(Gln) amidotransferase subunit B
MLDQRRDAQPCEIPDAIVKRLNLKKTSGDSSALAAIIQEVIAENAKAVEDYRAGKNGAMNFLVGCAMKKTRGRSDPIDLNREIAQALNNTGA